MKKGEIITLNITGYAFEGKGIGRITDGGQEGAGLVCFVSGTYPGDIAEVRITKKKSNHLEAKLIKLLSYSQDRVEPKCRHFGVCGGCKNQALAYQKQLEYKQQQSLDHFERIAGLKDFFAEDILGADPIYEYRNKMEYSFGRRKWLSESELDLIENRNSTDEFALGLHAPGMFDKIIDLRECLLQKDNGYRILNATRDFFMSRGISIYSTRSHDGFLRNLVVRNSFDTGEWMINIVTGYDNPELINEYGEYIHKSFPFVATLVNNVNLKKAQVATGDFEKVIFGNGYITDKIGGYLFRISPNSFFQTNTKQAEKLYSIARDFAELSGSEIMYDLYCGAGTIAIFMSGLVKHVYGFEYVESAVSDAGENSSFNDAANTTFFSANLESSLMPLIRENALPMPDVLITDPPRNGMHNNTVQDILELSPKRIVYISCNPATQARDVKLLTAGGYSLVKVKPVDMFPHTFHIEAVALLIKNNQL